MTQPARVKLTSKNLIKLSNVCGDIMDIGTKTGVKIKGEITSASDVQIDGDADINMETDNLMVGQTGNLKGDIKTKNADVWGEFDGNLEVTNTLTIQEKGVVKGSTKYSALQIKLGGQLQGEVETLDKPKIKAVPNPMDSISEKKS